MQKGGAMPCATHKIMSFTFQRVLNSDFNPVLKRSDGVEFSLGWIMDMKALGLDFESEMQNPYVSRGWDMAILGFTKVVDHNGLHFLDTNGNEVKPSTKINVPISQNILKQLKGIK
jgi:hypothetical protein